MDSVAVNWWGAPLSLISNHDFEALVAPCSAAERDRATKFVFDHDRRAYLAAHGLLRHALSAAEPSLAPYRWRFTSGAHGRPELDPICGSRLRFNLAHCSTKVNCIVCPVVDCGIDVESVLRKGSAAIEVSVLSHKERAWLADQPAHLRSAYFIRLWTLKEAVAKATGFGLRLPFSQLEFELAPIPRLVHAPDQATGSWWIHHALAADGHVESLCIRAQPATAVELIRNEWPYSDCGSQHQPRQ